MSNPNDQSELARGLAENFGAAADGPWKQLLGGNPAARREFRRQSEMDAVLMFCAGGISVPPGLGARVHRAVWLRQMRLVVGTVAAAAIIGAAATLAVSIRGPSQPDNPAVTTQPDVAPPDVAPPVRRPAGPNLPGGTVPTVPPAPVPPGM